MRHSAIAALALLAIVPAGGEAGAQPAGGAPQAGGGPRAVTVARTTEMIACSLFVDAGAGGGGDGTVQRPHRTIAAAVAAAGNAGAAICVAEGSYAEQLKPGEKSFTLAGGLSAMPSLRGMTWTWRCIDVWVSSPALLCRSALGARRLVLAESGIGRPRCSSHRSRFCGPLVAPVAMRSGARRTRRDSDLVSRSR